MLILQTHSQQVYGYKYFFQTQQLFVFFFLLFHHENVKLNFSFTREKIIISHVRRITNVWRHECELNNQHVNFIHSHVISLFSRGLQNTFHFSFFKRWVSVWICERLYFPFTRESNTFIYLQLKIINTNVCRWFSRVIGCVHTLWTNIITCEKNIFTLFFTYDDYFVTCRSFHKLTSWHFHMWTKISKWKENHVLCDFLFVVWDPLKGLVSQRSISLFRSFDVLTPVFNLLPISVKTCTKTCFIPLDHTLKRVFVWCDSPTGVLVHKQLGATATQMQRVSTSPDTRLLNYPRRFNYAVLLL